MAAAADSGEDEHTRCQRRRQKRRGDVPGAVLSGILAPGAYFKRTHTDATHLVASAGALVGWRRSPPVEALHYPFSLPCPQLRLTTPILCSFRMSAPHPSLVEKVRDVPAGSASSRQPALLDPRLEQHGRHTPEHIPTPPR